MISHKGVKKLKLDVFEAQYGHQVYPSNSREIKSELVHYLINDIRLVISKSNTKKIEIICYIEASKNNKRAELYYIFYNDARLTDTNIFDKFHKHVSETFSDIGLKFKDSKKSNIFSHIKNFDNHFNPSCDRNEYDAIIKLIKDGNKLEYNGGNIDTIADFCGNIIYNFDTNTNPDLKIVVQSEKNNEISNTNINIFTDFSENELKPTDATISLINNFKSAIQSSNMKKTNRSGNMNKMNSPSVYTNDVYNSIEIDINYLKKKYSFKEAKILEMFVNDNILSVNSIINYSNNSNKTPKKYKNRYICNNFDYNLNNLSKKPNSSAEALNFILSYVGILKKYGENDNKILSTLVSKNIFSKKDIKYLKNKTYNEKPIKQPPSKQNKQNNIDSSSSSQKNIEELEKDQQKRLKIPSIRKLFKKW